MTLYHLKASAGQAAPLDQIRERFYEPARTAWPAMYDAYSFELWVVFLVNAGFLVANAGSLELTPRGVEFIGYLGATPSLKPVWG
jgi:hypothetical protein